MFVQHDAPNALALDATHASVDPLPLSLNHGSRNDQRPRGDQRPRDDERPRNDLGVDVLNTVSCCALNTCVCCTLSSYA